MAEFMQFTANDGRTVFINRNMITDFSFDNTHGFTVVGFLGTSDNCIQLQGNQIESILRGWVEPPKEIQDDNVSRT